MTEQLRSWTRSPDSFRYVSDYLIREAHLTGEQVCSIGQLNSAGERYRKSDDTGILIGGR